MTRQLLPAFIVTRAPRTAAQWAAVWAALPADTLCPGLGSALPAALACKLVRRLPAADAQRLRMRQCAPLRPHPSERDPLHLPAAIVQRILTLFACA